LRERDAKSYFYLKLFAIFECFLRCFVNLSTITTIFKRITYRYVFVNNMFTIDKFIIILLIVVNVNANDEIIIIVQIIVEIEFRIS